MVPTTSSCGCASTCWMGCSVRKQTSRKSELYISWWGQKRKASQHSYRNRLIPYMQQRSSRA